MVNILLKYFIIDLKEVELLMLIDLTYVYCLSALIYYLLD